ncbi:aldehyde-activating protein [Mesorhizobium sp. M2A.F.Ca.ET.043.05.1.1]|nr:aldehyde-activating protein [Mesorhizobium sp. M2A.F.Ca.ET.043.05.1.1]TIW22355.1 MAG: GFA family protein [Mesorhizobium sp.]
MLRGGCRGGAVTYQIALEDLPASYACHSEDCQTWSGSAFALHAMLPESAICFQGAATTFALNGAERAASEHIGCEACMTRLANRNSAVPGMLILRAGTLVRSREIEPYVHIWTSRKQPWIALPANAQAFHRAPTTAEFQAAVATAAEGRRTTSRSAARPPEKDGETGRIVGALRPPELRE